MKKLFFSLTLLTISLASYAVPAKPGGRVLTQPDGSRLTVFAHGDEFHHYFTDAEGNLLLENAEGLLVRADAGQKAKHREQATQADNQRHRRRGHILQMESC